MGNKHGNGVKIPLAKPKVIDKIRKKGEKYPPDAPSPKTKPLKKKPLFDSMEDFQKAMGGKKRTQAQGQTVKPKVRDALKKNKQAKEASNIQNMDDSQKRGQVFPRYNLFEGRRLPKEPTKKTQNNRKKAQKNTPSTKNQPAKKFLPHIMKPLFVFPDGKKPEFLRKKTSGEA